MKIKPFGILPAISIMILSVGLVNHVLVVPLILNGAKRDAWMAVLAAMLVILPWTAIPLYGLLSRMKGKRIDHWLRERLPPFAVWIVMAYCLLTIFFVATESLIITTSWTETTYLNNTPPIAVLLAFVGLCVYAACLGLRTIAFASCLLLPFVVILGDFVMSANMPHKDYRYLLPLLESGMQPVLKASLYSLTAFGELFMLLLIQHHLKGSFKRWQLIVLVMFLALLAIGPVTGAISEFGPLEAEKLRYPAFSQWRLVTIGRYFEHVDFFAIYQWLSGSMIRISFGIYLLAEFSPLGRMKRKWIGISLIGAIMGGIAWYWVFHMIEYRQVLHFVYTYGGIASITMVLLVYISSFLKARRVQDGRARA
ncbi:endospore germination permease [Paenibacillus sp. LHD-117]|uniref:GerAB/ArcD/ProY family transporter n=1 Tax=Paenibacillus sp. LHD-117 TaxID=3071412 RepID=UPI0027DEAF5C|nr:endospore germination permease [Paenibacillus sp. LHD-117]MDQ6423004.1 endospore germination permease [Paenibacillus sp. LHD-117]